MKCRIRCSMTKWLSNLSSYLRKDTIDDQLFLWPQHISHGIPWLLCVTHSLTSRALCGVLKKKIFIHFSIIFFSYFVVHVTRFDISTAWILWTFFSSFSIKNVNENCFSPLSPLRQIYKYNASSALIIKPLHVFWSLQLPSSGTRSWVPTLKRIL